MELCLEDMREILVKNNQPFFLTCGTLLGQYRENKFIDYDTDIDIGIFASLFNSIIIDKILGSNLFTLHRRYGNLKDSLEITFIHVKSNIKIDIFLYYEEDITDSYYYSASFLGKCSFKPGGFCKWGNHIRGFTEVSFNNNTYTIPSNTDEFLTECYGNWRIPEKFSYFEGLAGKYKNLIN
jgi:phosphorylcholine metabolism protein LicD